MSKILFPFWTVVSVSALDSFRFIQKKLHIIHTNFAGTNKIYRNRQDSELFRFRFEQASLYMYFSYSIIHLYSHFHIRKRWNIINKSGCLFTKYNSQYFDAKLLWSETSFKTHACNTVLVYWREISAHSFCSCHFVSALD